MADLSPDISLAKPRMSRSSMSSNINPLPIMRRTSESTAHPSPGSTSMSSTTSSIPSFRAIRNLLPFGPSKSSSAAQSSAPTKHPLHFASLRRSSDRKASTSFVRDHQREHDNLPVISITRLEPEEFGVHKRSYDLVRAASASDSLLPSSIAAQLPTTMMHEDVYSPISPCPADLSTILEADNSGISKHIPSPSPSPPPTLPHAFFSSKDNFLPRMFSSPPSEGTSGSSNDSPKDTSPTAYSQTSCDPSPSASNLDLSLSKLSAELHNTLSLTTTDGWLGAVIVEDADALLPPPTSCDGSNGRDATSGLPQTSDPDATFDFSALDPDLAELLSPHRASSKDKEKVAEGNSDSNGLSNVLYGIAIPPTPSPRPQPASLVGESAVPLSLGSSPIGLSSSNMGPRMPTPSLSDKPSSELRSPESAVRSPESTLTSSRRSSMAVRRPPSNLPRLMRSVTSTPPPMPDAYAETGIRVHKYQPSSPLSAGLVSTDSLDTTRMRKSSEKVVPRPSMDTNFTSPSTDVSMRNARAASAEQKQRLTTQGCIPSPNGGSASTGRITPSVPCITTTFVPTPASDICSNTVSPFTTTRENPVTSTYASPSTTNTPHDTTHFRRRRHPHLFFSRKRSLSVDEPSSIHAHAVRPGSSGSNRPNRPVKLGSSMKSGNQILGARCANEEAQPAGSMVHPGEIRHAYSPLTRGPGPPAMEWLGPRTAKAFAAAGLFDGEREGSSAKIGRDRTGSVSQFEHEHGREGMNSVLSRHELEREGAVSVMSRRESPAGHYDRDRDHLTSAIHRYASLRDHAPSRAAFSEAASSSSLGARSVCTTGNNGAGWSPRTAFSGSTAPTSVSGGVGSGIYTGVGNVMGVTGTGPDGALRILQEKHSFETSALLGALADSQATCRKLKEENGVLKERLRELEAMINHDRDVADEEDSTGKMHICDDGFNRFLPQHFTSLSASPAHQTRNLTPLPCRPHIQRSHSHLHSRHHSVSAKTSFDFTFQRSPSPSQLTESRDPSHQKRQPQPSSPLSTQTPPSPQKRQLQKQRRASTTSSLFPAPPPEMSMLMLEDVGLCAAVSESPPSPGVSSSVGGKKLGHKHSYSHSMVPQSHSLYTTKPSYANQSATISSASTGIVVPSPSTATFSMTEAPGSPHSLQLCPEHELHLGDMASLSLYAMSDGDGEGEDEWKDGL